MAMISAMRTDKCYPLCEHSLTVLPRLQWKIASEQRKILQISAKTIKIEAFPGAGGGTTNFIDKRFCVHIWASLNLVEFSNCGGGGGVL